VSTATVAAFLAATFATCDGPAAWMIQYGVPYFCFSWWLFTVTYFQHHGRAAHSHRIDNISLPGAATEHVRQYTMCSSPLYPYMCAGTS